MPEVALILLGGTIIMTKGEGGGIAPSLTAEALIKAVPGLSGIARIIPFSPFRVPGASLTVSQLVVVMRLAEQAVEAGVAGVIVVQGTDTIEETAFVLDCMWTSAAPLVVTGAMRGPEMAGADGPANLLAAIIAATSAELRDHGVMVVMNDQIHAAEYVSKRHTGLCSAFVSSGPGPVGEVIENRALIFSTLMRRTRNLPAPRGNLPAVAIFKPGLGEDARLLTVLPDLGYAGLVVEAMGAGHVAECLSEPLARLAEKIPVILASRTGGGPIFLGTYGFKGSEMDLISNGLIPAGRLPAIKARLLLQLILATGADRLSIQSAFRYGS